MTAHLRRVHLSVIVAALTLLTPTYAQEEGLPQGIDIPKTATLEGIPSIRIDSDGRTTTSRVLDPTEAAKNPLKIRVRDGKFYWESRDDRPLKSSESGAFIDLSAEPRNYIRLTRYDDKVWYVEHVDLENFGSVTWWGEVKIFVGR